MSVYAVMGLLLSVWIGKVSRLRGPLHLVPSALLLLLLAATATLLFPEFGKIVLAARALEGIAFSIFAISGPVLATSYASDKQLPIVIGFTAMWIPIGQLSAALVAPLALRSIGWPLLWYLGIIGTVSLGIVVHRLKTGATNRPYEKTQVATQSSIKTEQRFLLAMVALVFMAWSGQYFAYMTWLPQYLVEVHGTNVETALLGYTLPVVFVILFNLMTGFALRAQLSAGWLMVFGMAAQASVWYLVPWTQDDKIGVIVLIIYGITAGVVPVCLFAMPRVILGPRGNVAEAFGIIMTGRNIGVMLGPAVLAQTFKATGSWDLGIPIFGGLTTICLVMCIFIAIRLRNACASM